MKVSLVDGKLRHPVNAEVAKDHFWIADRYLHVCLGEKSRPWIDLAASLCVV